MPLRRYRSKPTEVTAIQFNGMNPGQLSSLSSGIQPFGENVLSVQVGANSRLVWPGDWVIFSDDYGPIACLTDAQFKAQYELIE